MVSGQKMDGTVSVWELVDGLQWIIHPCLSVCLCVCVQVLFCNLISDVHTLLMHFQAKHVLRDRLDPPPPVVLARTDSKMLSLKISQAANLSALSLPPSHLPPSLFFLSLSHTCTPVSYTHLTLPTRRCV